MGGRAVSTETLEGRLPHLVGLGGLPSSDEGKAVLGVAGSVGVAAKPPKGIEPIIAGLSGAEQSLQISGCMQMFSQWTAYYEDNRA